MPRKVNVFIDAANIFLGLEGRESLPGIRAKLDLPALHAGISQNLAPGSLNLYISEPMNSWRPYFSWADEQELKQIGYRIIKLDRTPKSLRCPRCERSVNTFFEKTVDAALITGMLQASLKSSPGDWMVLVSGDSDFYAALAALRRGGFKTAVFGFPHNTSSMYTSKKGMEFRSLEPYVIPAGEDKPAPPPEEDEGMIARLSSGATVIPQGDGEHHCYW